MSSSKLKLGSKKREAQLVKDRAAEAGDALFLGINSGTAGESAWKFIQKRRALVGSAEARKELKTLLGGDGRERRTI